MSSIARFVNGASSSSYPAEFQSQMEDLKYAKFSTEELIDSFVDINKDYMTNGLNKYEKMADSFAAYAVRMCDIKARDSISPIKPGLEQVSRLYRQFTKNVEEEVIVKLHTWLKTDYKAMAEEVSKLFKARNAFDSAADNYRKSIGKPNQEEAEVRKINAEAAHEAQSTTTKEYLSALPDYWDMLAECVKTYNELLLKMLEDEKHEFEKIIAANKC